MRCTSCGAEVPSNSMFCAQCGNAVDNSNQVSLAKEPQQQYQQNPYEQQTYQQQQYQQNPYQQQ